MKKKKQLSLTSSQVKDLKKGTNKGKNTREFTIWDPARSAKGK